MLKKSIEKELDKLHDTMPKGAQIRSKAQWINEGERNTKFFLGLEKKTQSSNTIKSSKISDGQYVHSNDGIFNEVCNFYESLYKSKEIDKIGISQYLNDVICPKLTQEDKDMCDATPTLDECKEAVFYMKNDNPPGLDGLLSEFYKCFGSL